MTTTRCEVAVVGSGFAGSLLARILTRLGYDVMLLERDTHPRFAIGESSTPMANLTLDRLGARYGLPDCHDLAAHGRWLARRPQLMRGLKRGFTYYRHHPGTPFADRGKQTERLLVAASPDDAISDMHWLRADVDYHFVLEAIAAGVTYRDRVELTGVTFDASGARLAGTTPDGDIDVHARFVVDASGPGGFLARQLGIPSALDRTETRAALVYGHFDGVGLMEQLFPNLPAGPYREDRAAVHHLIDEGWMYSLRFDDGVTSAGFLLSPRGADSVGPDAEARRAPTMWRALLDRYPTLATLFADARPLFPLRLQARIQHRLARATGERWAMLPHAYAFVDPLFSTGIAWGLRGVERLALAFEDAAHGGRLPSDAMLARYDRLLAAEADQIDRLVASAYDAMADFDMFAAHAMIYFAIVSYGEAQQGLSPGESWAWSGFLGVGDPVSDHLLAESRRRLKRMFGSGTRTVTADERREYVDWVAAAIAPRNIAGLADPARHNLYPVDLDVLLNQHALLGLSRDDLAARLPLLRGAPPSSAAGSRAADEG